MAEPRQSPSPDDSTPPPTRAENILARLRIALADRYEVQREIGDGGRGRVFLAHDLQHDRPVAVKVPHPERPAAARRRPSPLPAVALAGP